MGSPMPSFHNAWAIYLQIRDTLKSMQHQLGPFLSDSSQSQDQDADNIGDTLLMEWEDFSDSADDAESGNPIADLTEDEGDMDNIGPA